MSALKDQMLDILDRAPLGSISGEASYTGRLATIQNLSTDVGCSDSATRRAVQQLVNEGLVVAFNAVDPSIGRRRIFVSGGGR